MMIKCNELGMSYPGGLKALSQVNFSLETGELAFISGPSGSGKSTFLKILAKLETPTTGEISVNGLKLNQLKKTDIAAYRRQLGLVFQTPYLLKDKSVFDNVAIALQIQANPKLNIKKLVQTALDRVNLLSKENFLPWQLSMGEQLRVSMARAIVHNPIVLIADEPTGNLDPKLSSEIMNLFTKFNQAGMSIIIATHHLTSIASMKHRILMLKEGKLC